MYLFYLSFYLKLFKCSNRLGMSPLHVQQSDKIHTAFNSRITLFDCLAKEVFCFNMIACHRSLHALSVVGGIACCHNFVAKKEGMMTIPS